MNEPRVGMPPDASLILQNYESRIAALENDFAALKGQGKRDQSKGRSPEEEAIRQASLAKVLEIAAELFPSPVKPILETLFDPDAEEELLTCTVEWDGETRDGIDRSAEWHRRIDELPGLLPLELGISVMPSHGTE